jgi:RNA-splicing ligase RtcB
MTESSPAPMRTWLAAPMDHEVSEAIERLRHAPDVQQIAVMPDVHLAAEVCIGVVVATSHLIYPQGVGGDIGCRAMPARLGEGGVLPGSMGSPSFHVEGRGHERALCSSAHGAGRALSRTVAREKVTERELRRQMEGIWYDYRLANRLRDEAPAAYKDIHAVLRAQKELVKVTRTLRPVLNYKGT